MRFFEIAERACAGEPVTAEEALAVLRSTDDELMELVAATSRVRRHFFGNKVKINYLVNIKSGLCPEDCGYCSQRLGSETDVLKYPWLPAEEAKRQAEFGLSGGASRVCLVASGRGPSHRDVNKVSDMVSSIKESNPEVEVCACLGFLKDGQAERLKEAGVDAYNHNLNTAASHYPSITSTHTFDDRVDTVARARNAGMSPCCGLIVGMGETDEQIVEVVQSLQAVDSDSIPVNFLIPFDDTPLAGTYELTPQKSMRILCAVRLMCPDRELRIAGGREMHLRSWQPVSLHIANSLFLGDYLTVEGQTAEADLDMIVEGGFEIVGAEETAAQLRDRVRAHRTAHQAAIDPSPTSAQDAPSGGTLPCGKPEPVGAGAPAGVTIPVIRRRGAGTTEAPNA